jgi:4-amino-4-deoxy-L-arabinose transferase-like glycosyltransferase
MNRTGAAEATLVVIVVLAAAVLFGRGLHQATSYDEGVYLASVDALRHGQQLGSEVFASQPPGFYVLLRAETGAAGRSVTRTRAGMLVLALAGILAAYALGHALAGSRGGIAAAGVLATAPAYAAESVRVAADTPSVSLALAALALAAWARGRSVALAAIAGAVFAAALSVKLLVLPFVVPLALILRRPRPFGAAALGALVVAGGLALAFAASLGAIWHDAVSFHLSANNLGGGNARHVINFFDLTTPFTWIVAAGACAAAVRRRHIALWLFVATVIAFLLAQRPLLDHHFVLLAAAGAVAAASSLPLGRPIVAAALALAIAAGWMQQWRQIGRNDAPEPGAVLTAARNLRAQTAPAELVGADLPIVAFRADRRLPGELVDTSAVRFLSGSLTDAKVLATLEHARVRTVVVGREFAARPRLLAGLRRYRVLRVG